MKKLLLFIIGAMVSANAMGQAKKPTLMVVPSDSWCTTNGWVTEFDNQGTIETIPNYEAALQSDGDLNLAVVKIGEMMSERGFPLKDLQASLRSLKNDAAEQSVATSSEGDVVAESAIDKLKKVARADLWIEISYDLKKTGPQSTMIFTMRALDAYTNKQVAAATCVGQPTLSADIATLIVESVEGYINNFNGQLQAHFDDMFDRGREITLRCQRWSGSEVNFESDFGGDELGFLIEDWLSAHAVKGSFSTADATENRMHFEQVRIPIVDENGRGVDARRWARTLAMELKSKYGIDSKLGMKGLGEVVITIGGK